MSSTVLGPGEVMANQNKHGSCGKVEGNIWDKRNNKSKGTGHKFTEQDYNLLEGGSYRHEWEESNAKLWACTSLEERVYTEARL